MRNDRARALSLLLLLVLPGPALAALAPVGAPFPIVDEGVCSSFIDLTVIADPLGNFEVVWVDDNELAVRGRHFASSLAPSAPPVALLPLHRGLVVFDFVGSWAEGFELAMNVADTGTNPSAPLAAYRARIDANGNPVAPPVRVKTQRFLEIAPAAEGDSLQFRSEPPFFGPASCRSLGLLARRIDESGAPISPESRVTRRASAWTGSHLGVERVANDTFVAVYTTCQNFTGLVARRLNRNGVPVGKAVNFPLPGRVGNFAGGDLALAARGRDFAVAAMVSNPNTSATGGYTMAVVKEKVYGPNRITGPLAVSGVVGMAASPSGGYLLLFQGASVDPLRIVLFAQELDQRGVPRGEPLAITGGDQLALSGAVASLPDGRWLVITRTQQPGEDPACTERLVGTVLSSGD